MAELPVVDDTATLIEQIKELAVVHGEVTLASGRTADYYVDMRRVTLDGAAAPIVGRVMRDLVADWDFEAVGGLTLGADPVATACCTPPRRPASGWTPSWSARRARRTACSGGSRARRSRAAGCSRSRTPARPAARC